MDCGTSIMMRDFLLWIVAMHSPPTSSEFSMMKTKAKRILSAVQDEESEEHDRDVLGRPADIKAPFHDESSSKSAASSTDVLERILNECPPSFRRFAKCMTTSSKDVQSGFRQEYNRMASDWDDYRINKLSKATFRRRFMAFPKKSSSVRILGHYRPRNAQPRTINSQASTSDLRIHRLADSNQQWPQELPHVTQLMANVKIVVDSCECTCAERQTLAAESCSDLLEQSSSFSRLRKADMHLLQHAGSKLICSANTALDGLTQGWPLATTCAWIFERHDVLKMTNIRQDKMDAFLQTVEQGYRRDLTYHNNVHAADVTLTMYSLLVHGIDILAILDDFEGCRLLLVCILAAAVHDFAHPGSTNKFQIEMGSRVSRTYNNQSPIENYSASTALLLADNFGLFSGMSKQAAKQTRQDIIDLVLATDMSAHFDIVSRFSDLAKARGAHVTAFDGFSSHDSPLSGRETRLPVAADDAISSAQTSSSSALFVSCNHGEKMLLLKTALKISDLGHCYLPWTDHCDWVNRLETEFFAQGDAERQALLDVSPLMDRALPGAGDHRNCVGFFRAIVLPMLELWVETFPQCKPLLDQAVSNLDMHANTAQSVQHNVNASSTEPVNRSSRVGDRPEDEIKSNPSTDSSHLCTTSCPILDLRPPKIMNG